MVGRVQGLPLMFTIQGPRIKILCFLAAQTRLPQRREKVQRGLQVAHQILERKIETRTWSLLNVYQIMLTYSINNFIKLLQINNTKDIRIQ